MDMKTNKAKLSVLMLAMVSVMSLAGSVTGTLAWYQYSTRATAGFIGSSKSVTKNLQISTDKTTWKSDLTSDELYAAAQKKAGREGKPDTTVGTAFSPITSGAMEKDAALGKLYDEPQYQYESYDKWHEASKTKYITFDLYFRYVQKVNGKEELVSRDVTLTDLTIEGIGDNGTDLSSTIRVHFSSEKTNALASKLGKDTLTGGKLDLNGDGKFDTKNRYEWETDKGDLIYGDNGENGENNIQKAYKSTVEKSNEGTVTGLLSEVDTTGDLKGGIALCTTQASTETETGTTTLTPAEPQKLTVTIWLEGWQKIGEDTKASEGVNPKNAAMWADDLFKKGIFHVGMQFGCNA